MSNAEGKVKYLTFSRQSRLASYPMTRLMVQRFRDKGQQVRHFNRGLIIISSSRHSIFTSSRPTANNLNMSNPDINIIRTRRTISVQILIRRHKRTSNILHTLGRTTNGQHNNRFITKRSSNTTATNTGPTNRAINRMARFNNSITSSLNSVKTSTTSVTIIRRRESNKSKGTNTINSLLRHSRNSASLLTSLTNYN